MDHLLSLLSDTFLFLLSAVWLGSYALRSLRATAAAYRADEGRVLA